MTATVNQIIRGSTVDLVFENRDTSGTLTAVSGAPTITIWDPDGVKQVDAGLMTQEATGQWVYYYGTSSTCALGTWRAEASANVDTSGGTRTEIARVKFTVVS